MIPMTDGGLSTSHEDWSQSADRHPFLERWLYGQGCGKVWPVPGRPAASRLSMPDTGAWSVRGGLPVHGPNLQQTPRDSLVRHAFVPSQGHLFLGIDYSCNDLRTLAAVCLHRYGRSVLADVLRQGIDLHAVAIVVGASENMIEADEDIQPHELSDKPSTYTQKCRGNEFHRARWSSIFKNVHGGIV